ncbi:uncharacterized protein LOC113873422 [Abrus precatorius]|uniref:Uncharacterized protein LOC113873422 n=1 Tax=Abrus precatorius TaxID=3816 RepID=A0A8B8MJB0_ABRPR|nr:uncharacterized protein LOC113873422 [Abrus precatorius]
MDTILREKDVEFDLESGGNTSEEDASNDLCVSEGESKGGFHWAWNGILNFDGSDKGKIGIESCSNSAKSGDVVVVDEDNLQLFVEKGLEHGQQQLSYVNGNHVKQKTNPKKPRKPPLPPKGPSLDAGDQRFVKELAELALRKRARIKKMKAVRKMKARKSSSSSSTYTSLSAMVITIFFFLVIILHGIRSASSAAVGLMASPEAAVVADEGLISVQYPKNFNTNEGDAPGSRYSVLKER